ncbi:MAG: endo-1,4-beta-xylanase [Herbinix sp.]|nr:endo-1,4-beta-xylanase [Herbinix sp.]
MNDDDLFYCHIGTDYVQKAFEYANKYADKDVKLFYNDYGGDHPYRRKAIINLVKIVNAKEKLIDGIGYQGYNDYDVSVLQSYPDKDNSSVVDALSDFYELGLEIHITEFTISNEDESYNNAQGEFMYRFMELIKEFNKDNNIITNVTIWGIQDSPNIQPEDYGYPGFRYSGIITEDYQPKESFDGLYKSLKSK